MMFLDTIVMQYFAIQKSSHRLATKVSKTIVEEFLIDEQSTLNTEGSFQKTQGRRQALKRDCTAPTVHEATKRPKTEINITSI